MSHATALSSWQYEHLDQAHISANYVRLLANELGLNLRDLPQLLRFTDVSLNDILEDEHLLSARQILQIFQNSLTLSTSPDLGLRYGRRLTPTTHGAIGFLVNNSVNLHVALKAVQHFLPTRIAFAQLDLDYHNDHVTCTLKFHLDLPPQVLRFISETLIVIFYACAEFIMGHPIDQGKLCFAHPQPDYHNHYKDYFFNPYSFSHQQLQIEIPLALCEIQNTSADQQSFLIAKQQCEKMLQTLQPTSKTYRYAVQKKLLNAQLYEPSEKEIADALFMSKRTLARHLEKEGTNFRQVRDEVLAEQAKHYLLDTTLSMEAIAQLLHYHDSANFRRAFKRWYQCSPQYYRQINMIKIDK